MQQGSWCSHCRSRWHTEAQSEAGLTLSLGFQQAQQVLSVVGMTFKSNCCPQATVFSIRSNSAKLMYAWLCYNIASAVPNTPQDSCNRCTLENQLHPASGCACPPGVATPSKPINHVLVPLQLPSASKGVAMPSKIISHVLVPLQLPSTSKGVAMPSKIISHVLVPLQLPSTSKEITAELADLKPCTSLTSGPVGMSRDEVRTSSLIPSSCALSKH